MAPNALAYTLPLPSGRSESRLSQPSRCFIPWWGILCSFPLDQCFPYCWNTSCYTLHILHVSTPDKLLFSCLPMCSGIVSVVQALSPVPPPVHFLVGFELRQEFPLGRSWLPAAFARLPAHQNAPFCFKCLFLEISWPPRSLCLSSSGNPACQFSAQAQIYCSELQDLYSATHLPGFFQDL